MTNPEQPAPNLIRVRVGCEFLYESEFPAPMLTLVRPKEWHRHRVLDEVRMVEPDVPIEEYIDSFGNYVWRLTAPAGRLHLRYDALAEVPREPDPVVAD